MADQLQVNYAGRSLATGGSSQTTGGDGMSNLPGVYPQITDGNLGAIASAVGIHAKIGTAAKGEVNRVVRLSSLAQARAAFGQGQLLESAEISLRQGVTVLAVRAPASVAGVIGAVTETKTGTGVMTLTGTVQGNYDVRVKVTRDGTVAAGDSAFIYSLDGGKHWSAEYALVGTFTLGDTGLSLAFDTGNFVADDRYQVAITAPQMTLADLIQAWDALIASSNAFEFVHVVGAVAPATAEAIKAKIVEARANNAPVMVQLEARGYKATDVPSGISNFDWETANYADRLAVHTQYISNVVEEWKAFSSPDVMVFAGDAKLLDADALQAHLMNPAALGSARMSQMPLAQDLGRFATGALPFVVEVQHDEYKTEGLNAANINSLRTYAGTNGFYFVEGLTRAPQGSDFRLAQNRRVCLEAWRLSYQWFLRYVNESFRVDPTTGYLLADEAAVMDANASQFLRGRLVDTGNASSVAVKVNRGHALLPDGILEYSLEIVPLGYGKKIILQISLINPYLQQVQANPTTAGSGEDKKEGGS